MVCLCQPECVAMQLWLLCMCVSMGPLPGAMKRLCEA